MKIELSDDLKRYIKEMKEALVGVSLDGVNSISSPKGLCVGVCRFTCSNYCRPER
jgi:hypothetical protein